jgi:hypothetical protein
MPESEVYSRAGLCALPPVPGVSACGEAPPRRPRGSTLPLGLLPVPAVSPTVSPVTSDVVSDEDTASARHTVKISIS